MSGRDTAPKVLVVGAGPTGLTMAGQLARHGVPVRIVDQAPHGSETSKALGMHARTLELMANMGLIEGVLERGLIVRQGNIYADASGPPLLELRLDELESPYNYAVDIPQCDTEALLREYLHDHGVEVEWQTQVTAMAQDATAVQVTLRRGNGGEEQAEVPWLVACDGAHSTARHAFNVGFPGKPYPMGFILADVKVEWSKANDEWQLFFSEQGILGFFPLRGGRQRIIAQVDPPPDGQNPPTPSVEEVQHLCRARGLSDIVVSDPHWLSGFRVHERKAERYRVGRVFLAGDAAHIHSPAGGQGMNTGIQDAYNLAWKLALVVGEQAPPSLLDSYEAERSPVADNVLRMSDTMTRVITIDNPVGAAVRNHLYGLLGQLEVVQHRVANELGEIRVGYRGSAIVGEHRDRGLAALRPFEGPHPGDRAPEVSGLQVRAGENVGLFDLLRGTRHTLLLFAGHEPGEDTWRRLLEVAGWAGEHQQRLIQVCWVLHGHATPAVTAEPGVLVRDPEGYAHRRYGAHGDVLYLVRPDGYVGYRSQPVALAPLQKYLHQNYG